MESTTLLRQIRFNILALLVLSLVLGATGQAKSKRKPRVRTPGDCTTLTRLHCEIYGTGDPMLFLHGLGGSSYSWREMVEPLKPYYQVILIDFRGEGQSPKPNDKHYSIEEQAELIYQFIDEKKLRRLTLVGNSYGGAVSLLLAIRLCAEKDSRLKNLILIDPGGYPDHLPLHLQILRTPILGWQAVHLIPPKVQIRIVLIGSYSDPSKITKEQIKAYAKPISERGGRHALLEMGKQAIPEKIEYYISRYPTISVPTLILWGEDDHVLRRDVGERLNKAIGGSKLEYIKYAGHIPQEERPDVVICRIRNFLSIPGGCPLNK